MPKTYHAAQSPLRTRALTTRPEKVKRTPTKAISQVDTAVIITHAADPAVLVDLHDDHRLSLGQLEKRLGVPLAKTWTVVQVATGQIQLASDVDPAESFTLPLTLDARQRLRLSPAITYRLGVPVGGQVLITASPSGLELRLINLGTLADALSAAAPEAPAARDEELCEDTDSD